MTFNYQNTSHLDATNPGFYEKTVTKIKHTEATKSRTRADMVRYGEICPEIRAFTNYNERYSMKKLMHILTVKFIHF